MRLRILSLSLALLTALQAQTPAPSSTPSVPTTRPLTLDDAVALAASGVELLTGAEVEDEFLVPAGGVAVIRAPHIP